MHCWCVACRSKIYYKVSSLPPGLAPLVDLSMTSKAQQLKARPASNRQRHPTERENYRSKYSTCSAYTLYSHAPHHGLVTKQHEIGNRAKEKGKKSEKHNKKTLRAAYLAHPESFECEPEELLSDIDSNEEHMVWLSIPSLSLILCTNNLLVFWSKCADKGLALNFG